MAFRPIRTAKTQVFHRVMLPSFGDIVLRCAVSIGQVHITHVTWSVSSSHRCRDLSVSPGHASCLLLLMAWGVSSNQKGEDPGASPDHASSLLWSSSALRSCSWSTSHYSCDLRRFVQSEMPRPWRFTWSCFLPFVVSTSVCAGATRTCRAFFWDYRNLVRRGLVLVLVFVVVFCVCYCSCSCSCFCCRSRCGYAPHCSGKHIFKENVDFQNELISFLF